MEEPSGLACTDAERRFARALAAGLRARRREVRTETVWVRPAWAWPQALCAAAGIVASVLSVDHPVAGVVVAAVALVLAFGDLSGRLALLRRITIARATQDVVSPPPVPCKVTLVLTAATDRPRRGAIARVGWLPAADLAALALVCAFAAGRVAGLEGTAVGAIQLVPTAVLILAVAAFADAALARPAPPDPSAVDAVLSVVAALDARPPAALGVEVVLAGAGAPHALGLRAWLAAERRRRRPEDVVLLHVEPCAAGDPVWWTRDGLGVRLRYHPLLLELCREVAADEAHLRARPVAPWGMTGARAARGAGWPALALGARPPAAGGGRSGDDAVQATVELVLGLVARLDARLGETAGSPAPRTARRLPTRRAWA